MVPGKVMPPRGSNRGPTLARNHAKRSAVRTTPLLYGLTCLFLNLLRTQLSCESVYSIRITEGGHPYFILYSSCLYSINVSVFYSIKKNCLRTLLSQDFLDDSCYCALQENLIVT